MNNYYVTYGNSLINFYTKVEADSWREASEIVQKEIGPHYCTIYDEDGFEGQIERYGLQSIKLTPHS